jgi:hypothetical protein
VDTGAAQYGDSSMDGGDDEGNYTYEDLVNILMEMHPQYF